MKNHLILSLCLPLLAFGAQNRQGAPAAAAGSAGAPVARQDCPNDGNCPVNVSASAGRQDCPSKADCPLTLATPTTPTTLKAADLVFAIEEERVAHDIYAAAAAKWSLPVFANIATAETRHAAALTQLAATIGLVPPLAQTGIYVTADLQRLHDQLITLVNESQTGALRAGALIEETDIADLRRMSALATDEATRAVLANLERASGHHLAAFVRNLAALGVTYQPQVLAADDFAALTAMAPGRGRGGQGGNAAGNAAGKGGQGYRGGR